VRRLQRLFGTASLISFGTFEFVGLFLGGDAFNGYVRAGRYYLGSHGHQTEVDGGVFAYSLAHGWLTYALFAVAIVIFIAVTLSNWLSRLNQWRIRFARRLQGRWSP